MEDIDLILRICPNMMGRTVCVLCDAAAMPVESYVKKFRPEFEAHVREKGCPYLKRPSRSGAGI